MALRTFSPSLALVVFLVSLPGLARAATPGELCAQAAGKALPTCIGKLSKASVACFKKTGAACSPGDKKVVSALAKIDKIVSKKCLGTETVGNAGYEPLTPAELTARFEAACTREVASIDFRSFGGASGPFLVGATSDESKCLLAAAKEAGKLLSKNLKQAALCAKKPNCDLDKFETKVTEAGAKAVVKIDKKCADLSSLLGEASADFVEQTAAQMVGAAAGPCDPLDTTRCLFPLSNDYFSVVDPSAASHRRLNLAPQAMPVNAGAVQVDPTAWNIIDGFSVGPMLLTDDQEIDLAMTGAPPITDLAASLDPNSPVVLIDAETGAKQLLWVERDVSGSVPAEHGLIMRVGRNLPNDKRFIVALRNMKDAGGAALEAGATFAAYRDRVATHQFPVEARRPHMEELFDILESAGIPRDDLFLAWDFSTQSVESTSQYLLQMRDDAFDNVLAGASPAFTVDSVTEPLDANIFRQVDGTFQVPLYLDGGGVPGSRLRLGADGLPENLGDFFTASYRCVIPYAATTGGAAPAVPARPSLYGHGLLGTGNQTSASHVRDMASEHNFVMCGTDWSGFASEDLGIVFSVLQDFSNFPKFIDRQHQGVLNFMTLGKLMQHANGFAADAAFQVGGQSVIDPSALFYDGNSQGGILGGVLAAFAQDITRFVLGVPGINYSTLLRRSVDFDPFSAILATTYLNELDRVTLLSIAQTMWDRTDPNGHVNHTLADTYPGTPAKKNLYQVAFGDHQVAPVTAEIAARSNGASIHTPIVSGSKVLPEVDPYYDIPAIPAYPFDGSAVVIWDSGNPAPPVGNEPPPEITNVDPEWTDLTLCAQDHDSDPHECPRRSPDARMQKSEFLKTGGAIVDVCSGLPCVTP